MDVEDAARQTVARLDRIGARAKQRLASQDASIAPDEVAHNPVPLAVYWANAEAFTVQLFPDPTNPDKFQYVFAAQDGARHQVLASRPAHQAVRPWTREVDFVVQPHAPLPTDEQIDVVLAQHLAVRQFFRKMGWIVDAAAISRHANTAPLVIDQRQIDATTFQRLSMVVALACVESLLHDAFYAFSGAWFSHLPSVKERHAAIRRAVARLSPRGKKRANAKRLGSPPNLDKLRTMLTDSSMRRLSFQDLNKGVGGARWVYKTFFGLSLPELFNRPSPEGWNHLSTIRDDRHGSIHPMEPTPAAREAVNKSLEAVRRAQCEVVAQLMAMTKVDATGAI